MNPLCQTLHEEFAKLTAAQAEARLMLDAYWQNGGDERKLGESITKVKKALDDYEQFCRSQVQLKDGRSIWLPDYIAVLNIAGLNGIEAEEIFGKIPPDGIGASSLRIESLDLSELRITRLERSLYPLVGLRELDLDGCVGLTTLEGCLDNNPLLEELNLGCCTGLTTLKRCLDRNTALMVLDLGGCTGLTNLEGCLNENTALTHLDLSNCAGLTTLEGCLDNNTALTTLDLWDCTGLSTLKGCLDKNIALTYLRLDGCTRLTTLEGCLNENTALELLGLTNCTGLRSLGSCLNNKPSLTSVFFTSSEISEEELTRLRAAYPNITFAMP